MEEMATYTTTADSKQEGVPTQWHSLPMWKKRLQGWFVYQLASLFALRDPVTADTSMFRCLCNQFLGKGTYVLSWDISKSGEDASCWIKTRYTESGLIEVLEAGTWDELKKKAYHGCKSKNKKRVDSDTE